jgi:hypothetical protein
MPVVPVLALAQHCEFSERFDLPGPGRVIVNVGDAVTPFDVVGYVVQRGAVGAVNLARALRLPPRKVREHLLVREGQSVRAGEVLAQREGGLFSRRAVAPADGRVVAIGAGFAFLEEFPREVAVRGCLPGRVVDVYPGQGLVVAGQGALLQGAALLGASFSGLVRVVVPGPAVPLQPEHIDATCHGAVLVAGAGVHPDVLPRAAEFGVQGLILGSLRAGFLKQALPVPVVLTGGFGTQPMDEATFRALESVDGRTVYALPRAGRVLLVCPSTAASNVRAAEVEPLAQLEVGQLVRLVSGPRAGEVGTVAEPLASSGKVTVQCAGNRALAPALNCEIIWQLAAGTRS